MITLLYFARLRESFGLASEQLELPTEIANIRALTEWLRQRGSPWLEELAPGAPVRVAVNQDMAGPDTSVQDKDEIAFFPPVTGG